MPKIIRSSVAVREREHPQVLRDSALHEWGKQLRNKISFGTLGILGTFGIEIRSYPVCRASPASSSTSRTLRARSTGVNGFWRNATRSSLTPRPNTGSAVYPEM